ncbi:hypothetical protein BBK36DRAFT_1188303 [Trichoderma citrinoviride]|uniref:C3H1-type domain-containing protein n=1 Tax=Trichoderma citrinoviride TaxID=58853 RepID=A0A2T4BKA1_9HYPO|nr:hypothetical protein BBK36DRAFT_1188303 [Trichoderma citrinoviride]PTB69736.1 hypothetical protein BBK36DRAFT_1188303 [Trichoderma citrinoviride]
MDRSYGHGSRPASISCMPWSPEPPAFPSQLRDCSAEAAIERQMGLNNHHHPTFSGYLIQGFGQNGRDAIGQQLVAYPVSQQQQQQQLSFSTAAPPSRGLSSHNWRILCPNGNVFTRSPPSGQTSATAHVPSSMGQADRRGITAPAGPGVFNDGYAYYLNRGNGELTRLVPADMLPALNEIPPREPERRGMVVLPPLRGVPPKGMADMSQTFTVKNQIDRIVATSPSTSKRNKVYCDMWIHEGRCAFTQTGCKFKHEMPLDEASQKALGLFQGLPAWYKKQQEELNAWATSRENSSSETSPTETSSPGGDFAWQSRRAARISASMDALGTMVPDQKLESHSSQATKSRIAQFVWGPIGPPNKPATDKDPWGKGNGSKVYEVARPQ